MKRWVLTNISARHSIPLSLLLTFFCRSFSHNKVKMETIDISLTVSHTV